MMLADRLAEVVRSELVLYERPGHFARHGLPRSVARGLRNLLLGPIRQKAARPRPADVLFLANEPRQYATLSPVRHVLEDRGLRCAALSASSRGELSAIGGPGPLYLAGLMMHLWTVAPSAAMRLAEEHGLSKDETARVVRWLRSEAPSHARWMAAAREELEGVRPRVLITADDVDARARWFVLAANAAGVRTIRVQFGLSANAAEWRHGVAQVKAVHGPRMERLLVEAGLPPQSIVMVGQPRFGTLPSVAEAPERSVLLVSQPFVPGAFASRDERTRLLRAAGKILRELHGRGWTVAYRAHPDEDRGEVGRLLEADATIVDESAGDFADVVARYAVVLGFFSTALIEATIAGRRVIRIRTQGTSRLSDELDRLAPSASTEQLPRIIERAAPGRDGVDDWLRAEFGALPNDGRALAEVVVRLLDHQPTTSHPGEGAC